MNEIDIKIAEYLARANNIWLTGCPEMLDDMPEIGVIEIAKMIQLEEHSKKAKYVTICTETDSYLGVRQI